MEDPFSPESSSNSSEEVITDESTKLNATGFIIFAVVSTIMAGYILANVVSTCRQYRELKQTQSTLQARNGLNTTTQKQRLLNFGKQTNRNGGSEETLTMEGLKFKSLFFAALFLVCFLRTLCLLFMTFKFSKLN